jgi:hypothetical protein
MRHFASMNEGKEYSQRIKPFNFILTCHVKQGGHPDGADPGHFHLITSFDKDPRRWLKKPWIDQYLGNSYAISTVSLYGSKTTARVKTYLDVAREYEFHPEAKCADSEGNVCDKQTVGLLQRRHVDINLIKYIGKESNALEDVEAGLIHSEDAVYTEYPDPRRDEWQVTILPVLKNARLADLITETGMSKRALLNLRAGRSRPHAKNLEVLMAALRRLGLI